MMSVLLWLPVLPLTYLALRGIAFAFQNVPIIGLVFQRIIAEDGYELEQLSGAVIFFTVGLIATSIGSMISTIPSDDRVDSGYRWNLEVTVIILGLFVLGANVAPGASEIATRFFFYSYFFIGLIIPIFVASYRQQVAPMLFLAFSSSIYFFYTIQSGIWEYAPLSKLLIAPAWELWSYRG